LLAAPPAAGELHQVLKALSDKSWTYPISGLAVRFSYATIERWYYAARSVTEARQAAAIGCYFSVNSAMLDRESGRKLVQSLPGDRLLTETDSPFTETDGRKSVPWDTPGTIAQLAEVRSMSLTEMKQLLTRNAQRIFRFAGVQFPVSDVSSSEPQ
jgi:hypothetical protein